MDQYLWPYYQKDMAEGRITKESAMELLECLWINNVQVVEIKLNPVMAQGADGFAQFLDVCVGGTDAGGLDATNELSYLLLESLRPLQLVGVDGCVRIHANTPDAFLHHVAECIKDGKGYPKLCNDEMVIPFYLANGATFAEANDWVISGCCENRLINRETHVTGNGIINYGSCVEMTFRNGKLKVLKDIQFGLQTGDPRNWKSYDEVWKAFCAQVLHLGKHVLLVHYIAMAMKPRYSASPATSMLSDIAMEHCRDLHTHGEYFPGGLDHSCFEAIGKGTAIDSLAAVKHLIFDTKKLTWDQLLTAMEANWEGHEAIRQMCVNAPKYGNRIEWVDHVGYEIETVILEFLNKHPKPHNQCFILRQIPVTFHVPLGKVTWATPNGRKASEYLNEGISPSHGMDVKGPTVSLNSMARGRNRSYREKGGDLINMKFSPASLAGEEGTRRLMHIIRTWSSLKHWHIQFNIFNKETLLAAQKDPEKYQGKTAIVTGSARGIGEGIAMVFAREGANVVINSRKAAECARVVDKIKARGGRAIAVGADVSKKSDVTALVDETIKQFGAVDILVNNAGIEGHPCLTQDLSEEQWDRVLGVNLKGVFLCCQAVIPQMMKQGKGRIVNIASTAAIRMTFFGSLDYTVSKHGVAGLAQHLAWELADSNVTVNTVCPGGVQTPLMEAGTTPEYREMTVKRLIPLGRFCTIEEIGEAVSFLASDRAAMITGQMLGVDGGILTGFGENMRAVVRKRMADMQAAHSEKH